MAEAARTRARRWPLLVGVLALSVALGGAGFAAGLVYRDPDADALRAATEPVEAVVHVELRAISDAVTIAGRGAAGAGMDVHPPAVEGATRLVVTDTAVTVGDTAPSGTYLGSISSRPVFVLQTDLLPYRDLGAGDAGQDVAAVQRAFAALGYPVRDTGTFDAATVSALRAFYRDRGQSAPGGTSPRFTLAEFTTFTAGDPVVIAVAERNTVLTSESSFARLRTRPNVVVVRADLLQVDQLAVGAQVQVGGSDISTTGTVTGVGAFTEADADQVAGVDVTVAVPDDVELVAGQPYTVTTSGTISEGPAVPVSALRQAGATVSVLVDQDGERRELPVTVLVQGDGWVRIAEDPALPIGAPVIVG